MSPTSNLPRAILRRLPAFSKNVLGYNCRTPKNEPVVAELYLFWGRLLVEVPAQQLLNEWGSIETFKAFDSRGLPRSAIGSGHREVLWRLCYLQVSVPAPDVGSPSSARFQRPLTMSWWTHWVGSSASRCSRNRGPPREAIDLRSAPMAASLHRVPPWRSVRWIGRGRIGHFGRG
jgi:hypothetical protein